MSSSGGVLTLSPSADEVDKEERFMEDNDEKSDGDEEEMGHAAMKKQKEGSHERDGGGVRFGSVRVHKHNLTLGDNPSAKTAGPPLTLDWNVAESQRFSNVDEFSLEYHGARDSQVIHPHRAEVIQGRLRQQIASQDHSAGSIRRIQAEVFEIREGRKQSAAEDPTTMSEEDTKQKRNGFLRSLFGKK